MAETEPEDHQDDRSRYGRSPHQLAAGQVKWHDSAKIGRHCRFVNGIGPEAIGSGADRRSNLFTFSFLDWPGARDEGGAMGRQEPAEIIFEFARVGPLVRVSAMDPATLTEVVIQGPANAGEATLRRAAAQRLAYVLERNRTRPRRR